MDRAYDAIGLRVQRYNRIATSEDELRAEIKSLAGVNSSGSRLTPGGRIMICAPFTVSSPIIIPPEAPGITICAASMVPIRSRGNLSTLFDVRAEFFAVEGLFVDADSAGNGFTTFVTLTGNAASGRSGTFCTVRGNRVMVDRILVDASAGDCSDGQLVDNIQVNELNGSHSASVFIDSNRWLVRGNTIKDGGGDSITIDANASECRVIGNDLGFGDYTSTASSGGNTFSGNVRTGVVTAHATDDTLGGNT